MIRWRIAAILELFWALLQLRGLLIFRSYAPERPMIVGWCLFVLALSISIGLWSRSGLARIATLSLNALLLAIYTFSVATSGYACTRFWSICSIDVLSQPVLVIATTTMLLRVSRLTIGWSGRER